MKNIIYSITILCLFLASPAWAGKSAAAAAQQSAFMQKYVEEQAKGGQDYKDWHDSIINKGGQDSEANMLVYLDQGKNPDGTPMNAQQKAQMQKDFEDAVQKQGFMGDPTDHGPTDWSNYDIQTDANGNITGFKEKDFDKIDTDHDGKISPAERAAWKKIQDEINKKNGGPPGAVHKNPDWDKDGDGKPDPGFSLMCFTCKHRPMTSYVTKKKDDDHWTANRDDCSNHGFSGDSNCGGTCPEGGQCIEISIDKDSGQEVTGTREKGSTLQCYKCKPPTSHVVVEITYIIIIIETPYERFVLGQNQKVDPTVFQPSSVMALAKVDPSTGKIPSVTGDLKKVTDFMGGFNVGMGPGGITTTGQVSMDQLAGSLKSSLSSGGSYGANCFDDVKNQADKEATSKGNPTSQDINEGKQGKQDRNKVDKAPSEESIKASQEAGAPAVSGPVVSCGTQNGNKVLKVYAAGGELVDTITQAMLRANPNVLLEKLGVAQGFTDKLMVKTSFDFAGYIEKFTGIPIKEIQSAAAQVEEVKSKVDMAMLSQKKNKGKQEEPVVPNDPLYQAQGKKKSGFGIFGGDAPSAYKAVSAGSDIMSGPSDPKPEDSIADQYYLHAIGYTPLSDPNSAWNFVDVTQKNMVIALVDSGLDLSHPDGPQYIWTNPKEIEGNGKDNDEDGFVNDIHGWNFVNENTDLTDYRGHGTFVAGILAAKWNNGQGIAGINPGAVIMPIKITDDKGQTSSLAVYRGVNFAVNHGAKIINLSIGGRTISKLEQEAIERANAMGVLVVVASGNNNDNLMTFGPASSRYALTVGMVDFDGQRSQVSNWGPNLQLVAPGEKIYSLCSKDTKDVLPSLRRNGYYKQSGTSFSTPMVTATASLVWAKNPQLTNQQVADIIRSTATPMGGNSWSDGTGFGLLNASAALRATADEKLVAMFSNVHINRDMREQLTSVDVYGTVRGKFKEFTIEAGKGKLARSFRQIAGPFTEQYEYQLIARLVIKDVLRGSKEWVLRLKVTDDEGKEHDATMVLILPDK